MLCSAKSIIHLLGATIVRFDRSYTLFLSFHSIDVASRPIGGKVSGYGQRPHPVLKRWQSML